MDSGFVVALVVAALGSSAVAGLATYRWGGGRERTDADVSRAFSDAAAVMVQTLQAQLEQTTMHVDRLSDQVHRLELEVRALEIGVAVLSDQIMALGHEPAWRHRREQR